MTGDREYSIKHSLTREVAYAGLPKARRARLHAAFASWLERDARDEIVPLLAHHYSEAIRPDDVDLAWTGEENRLFELQRRALVWLRRAAELAIGRFEIDDGLALLHRALDIEPDDTERAELWRQIGHANVLKFDGEAFWTAMQKSLEAGGDGALAADTYSELAFHTATRGTMWKKRPERDLIRGWAERALELCVPGTAAEAKALIARTYLDPVSFGGCAQQASDLAERLGDIELQSWAWEAQSLAAACRGDYDEGFTWARRRFDIVPGLSDPDHIALIYFFGVHASLAMGPFEEARRVAKAHDEITRTLTPHHRMHAAAALIDVERAAGRWKTVRDLTERAERAVAANIATPCAANAWSLLACALANVRLGDEPEAQRLERHAEELGMQGYGHVLDRMHIEIAIARGQRDEVERKLREWNPAGFGRVEGLITRLNALIMLERRTEIEEVVPTPVNPMTYLGAFALRALGFARRDTSMMNDALARFEAMGLEWHVAETRRLQISA
jgi:hypothetical protein